MRRLRTNNVNCQKEIRSQATTRLPDAYQKIRGGVHAKNHNRFGYSGYDGQCSLRPFQLAKSFDPTARLRTMLSRMSIATGSGQETSEHRGVEATKNSAPVI
jgi:hypothetical protein